MLVRIAPAAGRRVLNHQRGFLPIGPEGVDMQMDATVRKRLADGDAVIVEPPASDAPPPAKTPKK